MKAVSIRSAARAIGNVPNPSPVGFPKQTRSGSRSNGSHVRIAAQSVSVRTLMFRGARRHKI